MFYLLVANQYCSITDVDKTLEFTLSVASLSKYIKLIDMYTALVLVLNY